MTSHGAKLTDSQIACLKGVWEHKTSKEIAAELQLSPHTVDMHIKDAMRRLNVTSRIKAASAFFADQTIPPMLMHQSPELAAAGDRPSGLLHSNVNQQWGIGENGDGPTGSTDANPRSVHPSWFPNIGGENAERSIAARLLWIGAIAISSIIAVAGLLSSLDAISRYFIR